MYLYRYSEPNGVPQAVLLDGMPLTGDGLGARFGSAVEVVGNRLFVTAYNEGGGAGAVYVYSLDSSGATREGKFLGNIYGDQPSEHFGTSIAAEDNTLVIGAYHTEVQGLAEAGAVYKFDFEDDSTWIPENASLTTIYNPYPAAHDIFGTSVALAGRDLVVGTQHDSGYAGAAYLFDSQTGEKLRDIDYPDSYGRAMFGASVAITSDKIYIGSVDDLQGPGHVYAFSRAPLPIATAITGTDGEYTFENVEAGNYRVSEDVLAGWTQTYPYDGLDIPDGYVEDGDYILTVGTDDISYLDFGNWINYAPVASDDTYSTDEDTPLLVAASGVLANDTDANDDPLVVFDSNPSTLEVVDPESGPSHGTLVLSADGSFEYTPYANYNGPDSFTYRAFDGIDDSNAATVHITVNPVNDAPVAVDDGYGTNEDTALVAMLPGVLANDTDVDGDALTVAEVNGSAANVGDQITLASGALLTVNADGSFSYNPNGQFEYLGTNDSASDSFTYRATDGADPSNEATVTLTIDGVNDAPVAVDDDYGTNEDTTPVAMVPGVLANDTDVEEDTLTAVRVTDPLHGDLVFNADGSFEYTPDANYNGPDSFTYKANDGMADSNEATVYITVDPVNDAPVITVDNATVTVNESNTATNTGTFFDVDNDTVLLTASIGTVTDNEDGTWSWTFDTTDGPNDSQNVTIEADDHIADPVPVSFELVVNNVAPTADDATFDLAENSPNGTFVGFVTATDPGVDTLEYSITSGNELGAFVIDSATGEITVNDSTQLDFEATADFDLVIRVTDIDDEPYLFDTADVAISLLNQASITGTVYVDTNQNGLYEADEMGIDGVIIELLDEFGVPVLDDENLPVTATTSDGGFYLFEDFEPGTYQLHELQPTGVEDGPEQLGSLGGLIPLGTNDIMQLTLERTDASDYIFAEIGQQVASGDTATIGFWQNKHGQSLIQQGGSALAEWLTAEFANIFGNALAGATGDDVAVFYKSQLFKQKSAKSAGPAKVDAQFMAVALATYFTSRDLAGSEVAADFGFNVTNTGIGTKIVNVGTSGDAFAVPDQTDLTILQLLWATDLLTDLPDGLSGFAHIYDRNGDGVIDADEARLRMMANEVYTTINEQGDV